jgi:hypothetical protein
MSAVKKQPEPMLWLNDSRGIYIPRDFALSFSDREKYVAGVTAEQWAILEKGPEGGLDSKEGGSENYWDVWTEVTDSAIVTDDKGNKYSVYQDGDCWLIPQGMEWDDYEGFFVWPKEDEED